VGAKIDKFIKQLRVFFMINTIMFQSKPIFVVLFKNPMDDDLKKIDWMISGLINFPLE